MKKENTLNVLNVITVTKIKSIAILLIGMCVECFFVWSMSHLTGVICTVIFIVVHLLLTLVAIGSIDLVKGD